MSIEPQQAAPLPVTIVSGFLGAGKTTLMNRWLNASEERIGVLVNDFASINVDADLIEESAADRIALTNGCICCSIQDDLIASALKLVTANRSIDRVVIETSGISRPSEVARALRQPVASDRLEVDGVFCLIDASEFLDLDYQTTELAIDQAAGSDVCVLNKCDLVNKSVLGEIEDILWGALPSMRIIRTINAEIPWSLLIDSGIKHLARSRDNSEDRRLGRLWGALSAADHNEHVSAFCSWSWESESLLSFEAFRAAITSLSVGVFRAKGIVYFENQPGMRAILQIVGRRASLVAEPYKGKTCRSSIAMIWQRDKICPRELDALFAGVARSTRQTSQDETDAASYLGF
jgi:G3E family GTPase